MQPLTQTVALYEKHAADAAEASETATKKSKDASESTLVAAEQSSNAVRTVGGKAKIDDARDEADETGDTGNSSAMQFKKKMKRSPKKKLAA